MTPEQEELKKRIDALPVFDSALPVRDIEDGRFKAAETAVAEEAASLRIQGKLPEVLNTPVIIEGQETTLEKYIRTAKRYQLTEGANLYSTASARRDEVWEIPPGPTGQGHAAQRAAFIATETSQQGKAAAMFIDKLHDEPGAEALFKDSVRVFDIGYHNGNESAKVAAALQNAGVKGKDIVYGGMELVPSHSTDATKALVKAGVWSENIHLKGGKLGFTDATMGDKISPNLALQLEHTPPEQKHDIVLALNVSNFGDRELFWKQADAAMKPEAMTIALHDDGGDALDFRKEVNSRAGRPLMRNAGDPATIAIESHFAAQNRKPSTFDVPYAASFPSISDEMWQAMKENVQTAVFNRRYEEDVKDMAVDSQLYKQARLGVEFLLGQPLTTYSNEERTLVLDTLKEKLESKNYTLSGNFQGQIILSKEHSKDLEDAVQSAAMATGKHLKAMEEQEARQKKTVTEQLKPREGDDKGRRL